MKYGMGLGWDWDETGAGLGQFETVFLSKEIVKSRQKSHIEYINPNSKCFFQFGSVAQSVARLLCNWKVLGSNPVEGKVLFSRYLELSLEVGFWHRNELDSATVFPPKILAKISGIPIS